MTTFIAIERKTGAEVKAEKTDNIYRVTAGDYIKTLAESTFKKYFKITGTMDDVAYNCETGPVELDAVDALFEVKVPEMYIEIGTSPEESLVATDEKEELESEPTENGEEQEDPEEDTDEGADPVVEIINDIDETTREQFDKGRQTWSMIIALNGRFTVIMRDGAGTDYTRSTERVIITDNTADNHVVSDEASLKQALVPFAKADEIKVAIQTARRAYLKAHKTINL